MWIIYEIFQWRHNKFTYPFFRTGLKSSVSCVFLALSVSACSVNVPVFSPQSVDFLITGSLERSDEPPKIPQTDAELIKTIVTDSRNLEADTEESAWSNPNTGNSGMIIAIETSINPDNLKCKNFRSTVNRFTGVLLYDGQVCETEDGIWVLFSFKQR